MGFGAKTTVNADRERYSEDQWQNRNVDQYGQRRAVFDSPEATSILGHLTGQASGQGPDYNQMAGTAYQRLATTPDGINPFVEEAIRTSNKEGDAALQTGLAGIRAGAYRGGTGANLYSQGRLVADAANTRAKDNALARVGAFDAAAGRSLAGQQAGASGLSGLGQGNQLLAAQILAMLRGENFDQNTADAMTGGRSGTKSRTGAQQEFATQWGKSY